MDLPTTIDASGMTQDETTLLLALNNAHAKELGALDERRLAHLIREAFFAARFGKDDALLLAMDQDADYDSPNFLWFRDRYERFVYVDRVVVGSGQRGRGLARALYTALFARAQAAGHVCVFCEVNSDPPNPQSDAFHAALGFEAVGSAFVPASGKTVRYLARSLSAPA